MLLISEGFSKTSSLLASLLIHYSQNHSMKEQILNSRPTPRARVSSVRQAKAALQNKGRKHLRSSTDLLH